MTEIRDIRADLRARLTAISRRRREAEDRYEEELQALEKEESTLKAMIDLEEKRILNGHARPAESKKPLRPGTNTRLESEAMETLSDEKEWPHGAIKDALAERGVGDSDDPNFGRSIQGALLSLRSRELVDLVAERTWKITKKGLTGA